MPLQPILKWAGSKRVLAETVRRAFGSSPVRYREPCVGAACVYVQRLVMGDLRPGPHVVLADLNSALVGFYRALREGLSVPHCTDVQDAMNRLPWGEGWVSAYADNRDEFNARIAEMGEDPMPHPTFAALFLWMNRACFNGLFRVSKSGKFNTPAGDYVTLARPTNRHLIEFVAALDGVQLVCAPFQATLAQAGADDQVYVDPPYMAAFDGYTSKPWGYDEQVRLALACTDARASGSHIVASNANHPQMRALWTGLGFDVRETHAYHSVGALSGRRRQAAELLIVGAPPRRR